MEHLPVRRIHQDAYPVPVQSISTSHGGYVDFDPDDGGNELGRLLQYWEMLKRRKLTLLVITACAVCVGFVVSLYQTPIYMASATLEIQNVSPEPFEGIAFMNTYDPYLQQTQIQLLKGDALQERVYAKLSESVPGSVSAPNPLGTVRAWLHLPFGGQTPKWEEGIAVAMGTVQVAPVKDSRIVHSVSQSTLPQAAALDVDRVGAVDHHLGDLLVLEEAVDRAVAEDVVGDVLDELGLVGGRQRRPLGGEGGLELLVHPAPEVVLGQPLVVEDGAELVDQVVVDLLAQVVENGIPAAATRRATRHRAVGGAVGAVALLFVEALVERHIALSAHSPEG
jgi:hypothetical protein